MIKDKKFYLKIFVLIKIYEVNYIDFSENVVREIFTWLRY